MFTGLLKFVKITKYVTAASQAILVGLAEYERQLTVLGLINSSVKDNGTNV